MSRKVIRSEVMCEAVSAGGLRGPSLMRADQQFACLQAMGITLWQLRDHSASPSEKVPVAERSINGATPSVEPPLSELDWPALQQQVAGCRACGLCDSRSQAVFGAGSQQAELLIIGEAPGEEEDRQGLPFVGASGQLLSVMLAAIGLDRQQVYITNILKCRPPQNRDPSAAEIAACSGYLQRQIALLQPKRILALGRIAAHACLSNSEPLGKLRGRHFEYQQIPLLVSYHPAYLLRKPSAKRLAWQDLKQLRTQLLQGG